MRIRYRDDNLGPMLDGDILRTSMMDNRTNAHNNIDAMISRELQPERMADAAAHRPGFRTQSMLQRHTADAARDATYVAACDAKEAAYMEYQRDLISSWRSPESKLADEHKNPTAGKGDPSDAGTHELRGSKAGDDCTLNGYPGTLVEENGELVQRAKDHQTHMNELRRKSDEELSNAWRQT